MSISSTQFLPSDEFYTAPVNSRSRMLEITKRLPRVDQNGKVIPPPVDATVAAAVTGSNDRPPTMAAALTAAAAAVGVDVGALVDSQSFARSIGAISPSDTAGLVGAIQAAVVTNPSLALQPERPRMKPNPAQGSSGGTAPSRPKTVAEMIRAESAKALGQPIPPGSVV